MKTGFASIENSDQLHGNNQILAANQSHITQPLKLDNVFGAHIPNNV